MGGPECEYEVERCIEYEAERCMGFLNGGCRLVVVRTAVVAPFRALSRSESIACEISERRLASVRDLSCVPYFCLTSLGRPGCNNLNHVSMIRFSRVGVISSSSVIVSSWCRYHCPVVTSYLL